jgi:hypothetical protein
MTLSVAALVFNVGVLVYEIIHAVRNKRNPLKVEMYPELKAYSRNLEANGLKQAPSIYK